MINLFKLSLVGFLFLSLNAYSTPRHCFTVEACKQLKEEVQKDMAKLIEAELPSFIHLTESRFSQDGANKACKKSGWRLPTPREFALIATSRSADGILEVSPQLRGRHISDPDLSEEILRMKAMGYMKIVKLNAQGEPTVDFFYSNRGYKATTQKNLRFWTSRPDYSDPTDGYYFDARTGEMNFIYYNHFRPSAMCARD